MLKNRKIAVSQQRIGRSMKFGTMVQNGSLERMDAQQFEFLKNQDGGSRHFENPLKSDTSNRLADFDQIWHIDAHDNIHVLI